MELDGWALIQLHCYILVNRPVSHMSQASLIPGSSPTFRLASQLALHRLSVINLLE